MDFTGKTPAFYNKIRSVMKRNGVEWNQNSNYCGKLEDIILSLSDLVQQDWFQEIRDSSIKFIVDNKDYEVVNRLKRFEKYFIFIHLDSGISVNEYIKKELLS
jgi:hypothetical protein